MADPSTFIQLDRNILRWRWYQDANTFRVFIHLLLKAQYADEMYKDIKICRGDVVTSYNSIAESLGITYDQARNSMNHLRKTKEVTITRHSNFIVVSIVRYNDYQGRHQSNPNHFPINSQYLNKDNNKGADSGVLNETPEEAKAWREKLRHL